MSIITDVRIIFTENFSQIRKSDIYEPFVCKILNKSKLIQSKYGSFVLEMKQDQGEADFKSEKAFMDAKLLLSNKVCQGLSKGDLDFLDLVNRYNAFFHNKLNKCSNLYQDVNITEEFSNYINRFEKKVMKELLRNNIVVFSPLPVMKFEESEITNIVLSPIEKWLDYLVETTNSNNKIFYLAPTLTNKFYLREMYAYYSYEFIDFIDYFEEYSRVENLNFRRIGKKG